MFVVWAALAILRTTNWREWTLSVIGFILPYIFLALILYLLDRNIPDYFSKITANFRITRGVSFLNLYSIIFLAFVMFLVGIASFQMIRIYQGLKIYARMYYRIFFWIFIITLIIISVFYNQSAGLIYFLAIPVSYILTFYFYSLKRDWTGEIQFTFFISLLILAVIMG
jgi:formate hydrogenlyase subunit 3/multisubunit Na+/H+ antiporter MnhD subunit